jgi:protein involved in polysaccharide export with SLBB domain
MAGGINTFASTEVAVVRRGTNGEVQTINRDLDKVRAGEQEDLQIVENDLIMVPPNRAKIILSVLLSAVGYTSRGSSYSITAGRGGSALGGGLGGALLP